MKKNLRKEMLSKRQEMSAEKYRQKSEKICQNLLALPQIQEADTIHAYYPINQEVDIRSFIEALWEAGKKVVMPRADFKTKEMENYYVISFGQLEETRFGLQEPRKMSPLHLGSPDVVIVPGVAFSLKRYRLGYGGGFYDRFLRKIESYKIGVGFEMQIITNLPVEDHDQQLDLIITEDRTV